VLWTELSRGLRFGLAAKRLVQISWDSQASVRHGRPTRAAVGAHLSFLALTKTRSSLLAMGTVCLLMAGILLMPCGCQPGTIANVSEPSADRLEYITQFKKIDTLNRGHITLDQAAAYYDSLFAELDKNGDGFLDAEELKVLLPIMQARTGAELLSKLDRNVDGKVSRSEFQVIVNWLFQLASSSDKLTFEDAQKGGAAIGAPPKDKGSGRHTTGRTAPALGYCEGVLRPSPAELNETSNSGPREDAARYRPAIWRSRFLCLLYTVGAAALSNFYALRRMLWA
jgi:Ca2+-binding EF-hand superfamily protein